ncbi:dephospho-CoA kinase [Chloroflexota bacterium]
MKIIGVTGGIGTGKSTLARFLASLGARVIDVDKIGHRVLRSDRGVKEQLVATFGRQILHQGEIDRSRLAKVVFADPEARKHLNAIIHPAMSEIAKNRVEKYQRDGAAVVVLDAPLLLEAGWDKFVDEVWVTVAPPETVLRRAGKRSGLSTGEIKARIRSQLPAEEQVKRATVVIDTDCTLRELRERVVSLWQQRHGSS